MIYRISTHPELNGFYEFSGHVAALKKIFEPDFVGTKIYNLGTGKGASVIEVVKAFEEASGQKVPYEIVGRRAGDVSSSYATCKLAEKELGWKATRNLVEMCKSKIFGIFWYY